MSIDLRSDTFTKPTPPMLEAMFRAEVGDDVFGEDVSVNKLEAMCAEMFRMEAALFCPSGTMSNQIGINVHTQPGDEVICHDQSHVYVYEGGGIAFNSGSQAKTLQGDRGRIKAWQIEEAINPDDIHRARTSLVCLENTANRGGGSCYDFNDILEIKKICNKNNLNLHLDGARLWNALVAKDETPQQYGEVFDSISVCLSKGLGAPVGSLLLGKKDFIQKAKRVRKKLGGGMRQAGYLAAAGIYALKNNISRLAEDHQHTKMVGNALQQKSFINNVMPIETNILIFEMKKPYTTDQMINALRKNNILCSAMSKEAIRMVFHLDVSASMINEVIEVVKKMTL